MRWSIFWGDPFICTHPALWDAAGTVLRAVGVIAAIAFLVYVSPLLLLYLWMVAGHAGSFF